MIGLFFIGISITIIGFYIAFEIATREEKKMNINKLKQDFSLWSLYYRQEIVWCVIGFIIGALLF